MTCPSCSEALPEEAKYCIHCGIGITRRSLQMAKLINNGGWIARRALGGFFAGGTGWVLALALERTLRFSETGAAGFDKLLEIFPGQGILGAVTAGAFLGTVGGMIERSVFKSMLGGVLGALGGALGGLTHPFLSNLFRGALYAYSFSLACAWGIAGAMIGLSSGILEARKSKIAAGVAGGLLGGLLGGGLGSQMYGALLMEVGSAGGSLWLAGRAVEFAAGGIAGVNLWIFLGLAEKFYIFKRRQLMEGTKKVCDFCHAENGLKAWYCAACGSALQVAASREQIRLTPFRGLERVANAFQFLAWLSATAGIVTAAAVFFSFLAQNFLFALFAALFVSLLVYIVSVAFRAFSDALKMGMQIAEKWTRENLPAK